MNKINLLPPELRKKRRKKVVTFEPTQALLILVIVCELIAFAGVYLLLSTRVSNRKKELQGIGTEIARLEIEVRDVKKLEDDARALERKFHIIDELMFSRIVWSKTLYELSSVMPANTWITVFNISQQQVQSPGGGPPAVKRMLVLSGKIINNPGEKAVNSVGVLMNNIKNNAYLSGLLAEPELVQVSSNIAGEQQLLSFDLKIPFK